MSCSEPVADLGVVWLEQGAGPQRKASLYLAGERVELEVRPALPTPTVDLLQLSIDGRGLGLVVSGTSESVHQSFVDGRRSRLTDSAAGGRALARSFEYTASGDALVHGFADEADEAVALMPLSSEMSGRPLLLQPPATDGRVAWARASARDGAMVFWVERTAETVVTSRVEAWAYPSAFEGAAPSVSDLRRVGRTIVTMRPSLPVVGRLFSEVCSSGICVGPEGGSVTYQAPEPCTIGWWRWPLYGETRAALPVEIELGPECPLENDPRLIGQIEDDVVVLADLDRIYTVDLTTGDVDSLPLTDSFEVGAAQPVVVADRGHALLLVDDGGRVTRIDASGPRWINLEASACEAGQTRTVWSPDGRWVLQSCVGGGLSLPPETGLVVRVSPFGLETFEGIAMQPLGIDDEGNALLYSFDPMSGFGDPRGLFVLDSTGRIARVDDLDPRPSLFASRNLVRIWFAMGPGPQ